MATNNRLHPRIKTEIEAILECEDQKSLRLVTDNVSAGGVMLSASREEFLQILGDRDPRFAPNKPSVIETTLSLTLPVRGHGRNPKFVSRCRPIHVRRISQDKYLLGFTFTEIRGDGTNHLQAFINQMLKGSD